MNSLILADNQDITRAGVCYYIGQMPGFPAPVCVANRKQLLQELTVHPESGIILDYTLFDLNGADELIILHERFRQLHWLLYSDDLSPDFIRRVYFSTERVSFLMKEAGEKEIKEALYALQHERRYICPRISLLLTAPPVQEPVSEKPRLTATEREILKAIAQGKSTKEIAAERFLSIHTVTTHRKHIFRKIDVNNAHEATKYALRAGILDAADYYI